MKKLLISAFCATLASGAWASDVSAAIGVMATDNADFGWQANVPENGVIDWRWDGATKASVTVVSALTGKTVISKEVSKAGDEKYGSVTLPAASETEDQLFDLTVALVGGETLTARVARPAEKGTVLSEKDARKWTKVRYTEARLFAYDRDWFDGVAEATTATVTIDGQQTALPSVRGFGALDGGAIADVGPFGFSLGFGSATPFSTTLRLVGGMTLFIR